MSSEDIQFWLTALRETVTSYRRMIDGTVAQLTDAEIARRPTDDVNSVAVILRHLGGNLLSRWTDFLASDGEKPDRNRDMEFSDWEGDRDSLIEYFDRGWTALLAAIDSIDSTNIHQLIYIRGEPHTLTQALLRSLTHMSYHVGQIAMVARLVHTGQWQWLTIAPGQSSVHNQSTWGSPASRGVAADQPSKK